MAPVDVDGLRMPEEIVHVKRPRGRPQTAHSKAADGRLGALHIKLPGTEVLGDIPAGIQRAINLDISRLSLNLIFEGFSFLFLRPLEIPHNLLQDRWRMFWWGLGLGTRGIISSLLVKIAVRKGGHTGSLEPELYQ